MIDKLIGPVSGLLDKVIPDKDQAAKLAHEISTMSEKHAQEVALQQIEILKLEYINKLKQIILHLQF